MNFAREIIRLAFPAGAIVLVDDGDGAKVQYDSFQKAWDAVTAVCEADVWIKLPNDPKAEWMKVINAPAVDPEETAADMSDGRWISKTWDELYKAHG